MAKTKKKKFAYKPRSKEQMKKRASQKGGMFDSMWKDFPIWTCNEGNHSLRILPPTWDDPEHFGYEVWVNYGIGVDDQAYLSLEKMLSDPDPIAEERARLLDDGDADEAKKLNPTKRVVYWIIDRDNTKEGPQLWAAPWTFDRDLSAVCFDSRNDKILQIDDPEDGFDILFEKKGTGLKTKYIGISVDRTSSPLHSKDATAEKWLSMIEETPVPETLQYYEYDKIAKAFAGQSNDDSENDDSADTKGDGGKSVKDRPSRKNKKDKNKKGKGALTLDSIEDMDRDALDVVCEDEGLDFSQTTYKNNARGTEKFRTAVIEALGLDKEDKSEKKEKKDKKDKDSRGKTKKEKSGNDDSEKKTGKSIGEKLSKRKKLKS